MVDGMIVGALSHQERGSYSVRQETKGCLNLRVRRFCGKKKKWGTEIWEDRYEEVPFRLIGDVAKDTIEMELKIGEIVYVYYAVRGSKGQDGRYWANFNAMKVERAPSAGETAQPGSPAEDDDIPF